MREQSLDFLRELVNTPSPSGQEVRGQRVWLDYVKEYADETFSDAYGNCVAVLNKGGSPRLMLAAHADEIAMAVNFITDEGFIYVRKLGGIDAAITKAQRVVIHTRNGAVKGVVGNVAPHLTRVDKDRRFTTCSSTSPSATARRRRNSCASATRLRFATNSSCCVTISPWRARLTIASARSLSRKRCVCCTNQNAG
jgi:hypothetical protein